MISLDNGDKIRGDASIATVVDYILSGTDANAIKQLADGQLPASIGDLYTADSVDAVTSIILVNTDSVARTVNLYLTPNGGSARRLTPKDLSLGIGYSLYTDGRRVVVMDALGNVLSTVTASAHALGSSTHTADTLSNLNTKVSDATLVGAVAISGEIDSDISTHAGLADPHTGYLLESLLDAHSIVMAVSDNTPVVLAVATSRFVGRKASGNIAAMTGAEALAVLSGQAGATFSWNGKTLTDISSLSITDGNAIYATGNSFGVNLRGGTNSAGFGARIVLQGKDNANPGIMWLYTPNAAKTSDVLRMAFTGGIDIAVISFSNATITGMKLSGLLDFNSNNLDNVGAVDITTVNGIDYTPGSDVDCDIATIAVTGTPRFYWWEAGNAFQLTETLSIDGNVVTGSGALVQTDGIQSYINRGTLALNLRVSSGSATHKITLQIDANEIITAQATGDGAGGITSKAVGFYGVSPTTQAAHLADPADEAALVTWAAAINVILENLGIKAAA